ANANAIAGNTRLSDFEQRASDPIPVADAHDIVGQSFDRKVLAELSVHEVRPLQLHLPMAIRFDLVDEDCTLLAPMPRQVSLTVAVQLQPADATTARHGILPDPGVHSPALPFNISWKADVHR